MDAFVSNCNTREKNDNLLEVLPFYPRNPNETIAPQTCPLIGEFRELPESIPTAADILRYIPLAREKLIQFQNSKSEPSATQIANQIAEEIIETWKDSISPIKSKQQIAKMICDVRLEYRDIKRQHSSKKGKPMHEQRIVNLNRIFELRTTLKRKRKENFKNPLDEFTKPDGTIPNWIDQMDPIFISAGMEDELHELRCLIKECKDDDDDDDDDDNSKDANWELPLMFDAVGRQIRINLAEFAIECDRFKISTRAAAYLANALLKAFGIITEFDRTFVIDRMRIQRARDSIREKIKIRDFENSSPLFALSFDSRFDWTKILEIKDGKNVPKSVRQNHCVLVQVVGLDSFYLGHLTIPGKKKQKKVDINQDSNDDPNFQPPNQKKKSNDKEEEPEAEVVRMKMIDFFESNKISLNELGVIICDGCNVNMGQWKGIVRRLEEFLSRALQRSVCLFHGNELPLRHLFMKVDNCRTSGPNCFSGEIGKLLQIVETLPISKKFKPIKVDDFPILEDEIINSLSRDQKLLYHLCQLVQNGFSPEYFDSIPGALNHARWLTLALRILRLYITFEQPPEEISLLASYVVRCYAPCWFDIKRRPLAIDGPWNFCNMVKRSRFLPDDCRTVVDETLLRNSYFAHFENVLLAMIGDQRETVRNQAIQKILEIRNYHRNSTATTSQTKSKQRGRPKKVSPKNSIRRFALPKSINLGASDYYELVDWESLTLNELNEPPLTMKVPDDELDKYIVPDYPSNSQGTERCVRLVTEASESVYGEENRDLIIRSTVYSRSINSTFNTKSKYHLLETDNLCKKRKSDQNMSKSPTSTLIKSQNNHPRKSAQTKAPLKTRSKIRSKNQK